MEEPEQDGALRRGIDALRPDVEGQTVLVLGVKDVAHHIIPADVPSAQLGTDVPVHDGVLHAFPGLHRLGHTEASCFRVGHAAEDIGPLRDQTAQLSRGRFNHGGVVGVDDLGGQLLDEHGMPPFMMRNMRFGSCGGPAGFRHAFPGCTDVAAGTGDERFREVSVCRRYRPGNNSLFPYHTPKLPFLSRGNRHKANEFPGRFPWIGNAGGYGGMRKGPRLSGGH